MQVNRSMDSTHDFCITVFLLCLVPIVLRQGKPTCKILSFRSWNSEFLNLKAENTETYRLSVSRVSSVRQGKAGTCKSECLNFLSFLNFLKLRIRSTFKISKKLRMPKFLMFGHLDFEFVYLELEFASRFCLTLW